MLVFFTYLYAPTVLDSRWLRAIGFGVDGTRRAYHSARNLQGRFRSPAALCYLTESERQFVQQQFSERPLLEDVIGVGVDIPQQQPYPRMPVAAEADATSSEDGVSVPGNGAEDAREQLAREFPSHLLARGAVFRRRHRLHGPIVLYGGRIDPGKGCE